MRDTALIDTLLRKIRELWLQNEAVSVCKLIHAAVDPAVRNEEIRALPDKALLQSLRAMAYCGSDRSVTTGVVTVDHLAALDAARDYNAASTYNWLNAELERLRKVVRVGVVVRVEEESGPVVLSTEKELLAWVRGRYPFAKLAESDAQQA